MSQLESAMVLGKLGEQVTLKSETAFNALRFKEAIIADKEIYYPQKLARDTAARNEFSKEKRRASVENEIYILDIIRERWKNDDNRLQRIILK